MILILIDKNYFCFHLNFQFVLFFFNPNVIKLKSSISFSIDCKTIPKYYVSFIISLKF